MPPRERLEIAHGAQRQTRRGKQAGGESGFKTRREEILHAAVAPLNRHGLRGMTLAHVAERLGLAPTAVGYYFRRKEDLASALHLASLQRLSAMADAAAIAGPDAPAAMIRAFFDFRRRTELGLDQEIAWMEDVRTVNNAEVAEAYVAFFRKIRALFGPVPSEAQKLRRNIEAHHYLSQLYWAVGRLPHYNPHDYQRMAERLIAIYEHGLAADGRDYRPLPLQPDLPDESEDAHGLFLRAATELINERGYLGASVDKIAERLNRTKGAFYHRHEAKSDLIVQCFERTWNLVGAAQKAADEATSSGLDNLASVANFLVHEQLSGRWPMIRTAALAAVPAELRQGLITGFNRIAFRFASVVCDGIADGSVRPLETPVAAHVLSGAINSTAELHFWAPGLSPEKTAELYLRPLFLGAARAQA